MTIFIAAVHMAGGTQHEHVSQLVWVSEETYKSGISPTGDLVNFIENGNSVMVGDGTTKVAVGVVKPQYGAPYLRTYADKQWTDNLLALPRY